MHSGRLQQQTNVPTAQLSGFSENDKAAIYAIREQLMRVEKESSLLFTNNPPAYPVHGNVGMQQQQSLQQQQTMNTQSALNQVYINWITLKTFRTLMT